MRLGWKRRQSTSGKPLEIWNQWKTLRDDEMKRPMYLCSGTGKGLFTCKEMGMKGTYALYHIEAKDWNSLSLTRKRQWTEQTDEKSMGKNSDMGNTGYLEDYIVPRTFAIAHIEESQGLPFSGIFEV